MTTVQAENESLDPLPLDVIVDAALGSYAQADGSSLDDDDTIPTLKKELLSICRISRLHLARLALARLKTPSGTPEYERMTQKIELFKKRISDHEAMYEVFQDKYVPPVVVPRDMPLFQWTGYASNKTKEVFSCPEDALYTFENIMTLYGLDHDKNWRRLVPVNLQSSMRHWFDNNIRDKEIGGWKDFKRLFLDEFGMSAVEKRLLGKRKLETLTYIPGSCIRSYIRKYRQYLEQSGIDDPSLSVYYLLRTIPREAQFEMRRSFVDRNIPQEEQNDPEVVIRFLKEADDSIRGLRIFGDDISDVESIQSEPSEEKFCNFHNSKSHSSEECTVIRPAYDVAISSLDSKGQNGSRKTKRKIKRMP